MAAETGEIGPGRGLEGRESSFNTLSEMFSTHYLTVLTHPLRISSAICSCGSFLILFTSLTTSYWVTERSPHGLVHWGLWETCLRPSCFFFFFSSLAEYLHVTRAFLIMAVLCGLTSLFFICISFERVSVGPVYFMVAAGLLSCSTGFFTLIAISVFTVVNRSTEGYMRHILIFGSSYGLCWASIPIYVFTGAIIMITHRTSLD
ncbi:protein NKG7-like [Paroedura picta]|uniref:protein NKG7-like n=1 Tax=Paroedura picta TaxID=143630 RepID=UPI004055C692